MLKQELYKTFIKNKMLLLSGIYLVLYTAFWIIETGVKNHGWSGETYYYYNTYINWFLVFVILVLVKQLYITDYEKRTEAYILTAENGRLRLNIIKILIIFFTTLFLAAMSQVIMITVIGSSIGFSGADIQQVEFLFALSTRKATGIEAMITGAVLNSFGYVIVALRFIFFAVLIKNSTGFLASCIVLIISPTFIINDYNIMLRVPLGSSYFYGMAYYWGDLINEDPQGTTVHFKEITDGEFITVLILQIVVTIILLTLAMMIVNRKFSFIKLKKNIRKAGAVVVSAFMIFTLAGCSGGGVPESECNRYLYIEGDLFYDVEANKKLSVNNSFYSNKDIIAIDGRYAIVKEMIENSDASYTVKKVDLETYAETPMITLGTQSDRNALLGLDKLIVVPNFIGNNGYNFLMTTPVYYENKLYFGGKDEIIVIDLTDNTMEKLEYKGDIHNVLVTKLGIFYNDYETYETFLNGETFLPELAFGIIPTDEKVYYYTDTEEGKKIKVWNSKDKSIETLVEGGDITFMYADDEKVVYHLWDEETSKINTVILKDGKSETYPYFMVAANESKVVMSNQETDEYVVIDA